MTTQSPFPIPEDRQWADKLEALAPIVDDKSLGKARKVVYAMRDEAWAKRSAAWNRFYAKRNEVWAADAAADAADAPDKFRRIFDAAKQAHEEGKNRYAAARKVADEVMAEMYKPRFQGLRDELDTELIALIKRIAAVTEADVAA